jgi:hypothetical protein
LTGEAACLDWAAAVIVMRAAARRKDTFFISMVFDLIRIPQN